MGDPNLDRGRTSRATNHLDSKYFGEAVARFDFVDKFPERHPIKFECIWIGRSTLGQFRSYLDRAFIRRVY